MVKVRISPHLTMINDAIGEIVCTDHKDMEYVISDILLDHPYLIYRGQKDARWPLISSIDRLFNSAKKRRATVDDAQKMLMKFQYSTRGRIPQQWAASDEYSWWALGQHFGLATPLLDWTESPFVAEYFAFIESAQPIEGMFPDRIIYAIDPVEIENKNVMLDVVERVAIVRPLLDYNSRLVNQRGLFTSIPLGDDLEAWVRRKYAGVKETYVLIKIVIPEHEGDRTRALQFLNRANINHLTLFPDLLGSSVHCNNSAIMDNYD
jgi:hypothetical protein